MINMIKAELYRMTRTKGIYIFWAAALFTYAISIIYKEAGGISFGAPVNIPDGTKMDISMIAHNFTFYFLLIIPVFGVIAAEFSEHTVKNTISSAISKKQYFISKFVFTLLYSLISFIAANFLFYILNRIVNGEKYSSSIGVYVKAFLMQIPLFTAIVSAFIFLAFLFRKGAAFNSVTILAPLLYTTVAIVMYGIEDTKKLAEKLLTYEISSMIINITLDPSDSYRNDCYIICAAVTALSFILGYLSFTKRELD